jgi:hypothetical protein
VRFFRRRDRALRPLGEAEAYARVHGDRSGVRIVRLPARRKRYALDVSGEALRRRFEERIDARDPEEEPEAEVEAAALRAGELGDEPILGEELASLLEAEVARRDEGVGGMEVVGGE